MRLWLMILGLFMLIAFATWGMIEKWLIGVSTTANYAQYAILISGVAAIIYGAMAR